MAGFLELFGQAAGAFVSDNTSSANTSAYTECPEPINRQSFFLFMLIPACICTLILMFTKKRINVKTDCCYGRPGVVFPQDMMGRTNRISQAAAFGCIVSISYEVIFNQKYAFHYTGPMYLKVFVALTSMMIYGVDYYPLFASLTVNNMIGYLIGSLYAWTLAVVEFYKTFSCDILTAEMVGLILAHSWPKLLCHVYLCFIMPARLIIGFIKRNDPQEKTIEEYLMESYSGIHVKMLFKPPPPPPPEPTTKTEKILSIVKTLTKKLLYSRVENFRYSGRILSVMTVAFILMYMVTVELLIAIIPLFHFFEMMLVSTLTNIGVEPPSSGEDPYAQARILIFFLYYILIAIRACFLTSLLVGFVFNCFTLLHSLSTYRSNLLNLYKGKTNFLMTKDEKSNSNLLVGSMRYAGYQVAYIGWGYLVQFLIMFLVSVVLALIIILIRLKIVDDWFLHKFNAVWPVLLTTLAVNLIQTLVAKFAFLQDRGNILAINNRRLFFIVVYFMFFYNIFLGLVSCLLRILKALVTGAFLLPRLDHSTLPRRFQFLDPGFDAYCGFMHVESAHTNPVAETFINVLEVEAFGKSGKISISEDGYDRIGDICDKTSEDKHRRHRQVIFKWKLAYTLLRNPELILRRKTEILKAIELLGMEKLSYENNKDTEAVSLTMTTKC